MAKLRFTFNVKLFPGLMVGVGVLKKTLDTSLVVYVGFFRVEVKFFRA